MKAGLITAAALGSAAFAIAPARAADDFAFRSNDNAVWATVGSQRLDYAENWQGQTVDSERGWLPGGTVGASILTVDDGRAPLRNFYARLEGSYSAGSADYRGQYQNGTATTTTTNETMWTGSARVGRAFMVMPVALIPYAELGYRYWDRNITGSGGYDETYHNGTYAAGLMVQYSPLRRWMLTGDGAFGYTFMARMHAGDPYGANYTLGGEPAWHVGGQIGYTFTKQLEAIGTIRFSQLSYGLSPGVNTPLGTAMEPDSVTRETTLQVGLSYHFF